MAGITLNASVIPAKAGFTLTLWWYPEGDDEWADIIDQVTDAAGKTSFTNFAFPYYPVKARVTLPAGQVVGGVAYGGYTTPDLICRDNVAYNVSLFPEPSEQAPYLEEVYRDVEIWWIPSLSAFRAEVAAGFVAVATTLPVIRAQIDEILAFLYPPEDPTDGLFAQIVVAVKVWVMENMPGWVLEWGSIVNNYLTEVINNITNVYNDLREYVTNVYNNVYETVENIYNTFQEYVTNVYNYLTEEITNIYNNTYNYFTEVIGASVEWVEERLAGVRSYIDDRLLNYAPQGFQSDPELYVMTHAEERYNWLLEEAVTSFWEGFEEGLAEEVEI